MKIKTPFFIIEIELLLIVAILVTIFSQTLQRFMISFYTCYLFILFHEMAHIFVASIFSRDVEKLKLSLSGVSVTFKKEKYNIKKINNKSNIIDILIYLAGPISNLLLAVIFNKIRMIVEINTFLALLNLLPLYPLDGYNILSHTLNLFNNKLEKNRLIADIIGNIMFFILVVASVLQIVLLKNISIFIFVIYLYFINLNKRKNSKIVNFAIKSAC